MESLITIVNQETPDWYDNAQCVGTSTEIFFPDNIVGRGESVRKARMISLAKSICGACVVREICLEHAIRNNEQGGVWGGKTEKERNRLRIAGAGRK